MVVFEDSDFLEDSKSCLLVILNNLHFDSLESADRHPQKNRQQNSCHLVDNAQSVVILDYFDIILLSVSLWEIEQINQLRDLEDGPEEEHDVGVAKFLFYQDCLHGKHAHQRHRAAH